jgi:DNA-binding MarR family transcriptional regulator
MENNSKPTLADIGYNEQLVLFYLSRLPKSEDLVNQKQISEETGLYYATLRQKLEALEQLHFVFITQKGREKLVTITEKGQKALEEWRKTLVGKKILAKIEEELDSLS